MAEDHTGGEPSEGQARILAHFTSPPPNVTIAPAEKYIVTAMQGSLTAGNIGPSATPAVPPTSVEEAWSALRDDLARRLNVVTLPVAVCKHLHAYQFAVREEERARTVANMRIVMLDAVCAMVEDTPLPRDPSGMGISVDASNFKADLLAGLAKLGSQ